MALPSRRFSSACWGEARSQGCGTVRFYQVDGLSRHTVDGRNPTPPWMVKTL
jgi:hypothetical protein